MIDFPATPIVNQVFVAPNNVTYVWDGSCWTGMLNPQGVANQGDLFGLNMANNGTHGIDIATGWCASDASPFNRMDLTALMTKQSNVAWAEGGPGWLDTGAATNAWYYPFLIQRPDTGRVDSILSLSATSPLMPANYTRKRRIGSILRLAAAVRAFVQDDDDIWWKDNTATDFVAVNPGTAGVLRVISAPTAFSTLATITVRLTCNDTVSASTGYLSSPLVNDDTATGITANIPTAGIVTGNVINANAFTQVKALTDTAGRIRTRVNVSNANVTIQGACAGFTDKRGRQS